MPLSEDTSCCNFIKSTEIMTSQPAKSITFFEPNRKEKNIAKRILYWICGIESTLEPKNVELKESNANIQNLNISIDEEPFWSRVNHVNMVFQFCLSGFMWCFFNKFN